MAVASSRDYSAVRTKAEGVFRILVLGDSMVYGHGVPWRQTLPAALEGYLNGALWDQRIEVINGGVIGFGLFEMRSIYDYLGEAHAPDLIVLVLCENDALLALSSDRYFENVAESWRADGATFDYFRQAFSDFVGQVAGRGLPLAVAFYQMGPAELREAGLSAVDGLCRQAEIPFVDLSGEFQSEHGDDDAWLRWRVSSANCHPTGPAHNLAGRRLGRALIQAGLLAADGATPEADVLAELGRQSAAAVRSGRVALWEAAALAELWQRKKGCPGRLRLPRERRLPSAEFRRGKERTQTLVAAAAEQLSWQGLLSKVEVGEGELRRLLDDFAGELNSLLHKDLFIVERNLAGHQPPFQIAAPSGRSGASPHRLAPMAEMLQRTLAVLAAATARVEALDERLAGLGSAPRVAPMAEALRLRGAELLRLVSWWRECSDLLTGFAKVIARCRQLADGPGLWDPGLVAVTTHLAGLETDLLDLGTLLSLDRLESWLERPPAAPSGSLALAVTAQSLDGVWYPVDVKLRVEGRAPKIAIEENHWAIRDHALHTYRFELPPMTCFDVEIRLPPLLTRLERLSIEAHPGEVREFGRRDLEATGHGSFRLDELWFPL